MKKCSHCDEQKATSEFHRKSGEILHNQCKSCRTVSEHERYAGLQGKHQELKIEVVGHYGVDGGCVCCGEKQIEFLTLDHIIDNGAEDRKKGSGRGLYLYRRLKRLCFPPGFQTLCANCNLAKQLGKGFCPHHPTRDLRRIV